MPEDPRHLRLFSQCGICADSIRAHHVAVALYRSSSNPAPYRCSRPFYLRSCRDLRDTFLGCHNAVGISFCGGYDCRRCAASREAAAVHYSCYEIFMHECLVDDRRVLFRRLFVLASWKKPWDEAQPLFLPSRVDKRTLDAVAGMFGLPQLCGLPVELVEIIRGHSAHSSFWRSIAAVRVAAHVSDTRDESQQSEVVALRHVVSWERGGELDKSDSRTLAPVIRLTMDSDGISRVERLSSHPRYLRGNHTHTAYLVGSDTDEELSEGVQVEIVDGHLRLKLQPNRRVPPIWNTPTPPLLSLCNLSPYRLPATWSRLFAVETDSIRGITFFYCLGRLCDMHIHYPKGPSAQSTYNRMKSTVQRDAVWLYLPIPQGDRLTVVGVRQQRNLPFCHLFRLGKSGDVIMGAHGDSSFEDICQGTGASITLVYAEPKRAGLMPRVKLVGAKSNTELRPSLPDDFPLDKYEAGLIARDSLLKAKYSSWAPLDGVASALVFRDQATGRCKGILFHYLNGGSRAIGECRLHVDPAQRVAGPSLVCVQTEACPTPWVPGLSRYRTRVMFQHDAQREPVHGREHEHEQPVDVGWLVDDEWLVDKQWKCYPMTGYAKFWITVEGSSFMSITTASHTETAAQN